MTEETRTRIAQLQREISEINGEWQFGSYPMRWTNHSALIDERLAEIERLISESEATTKASPPANAEDGAWDDDDDWSNGPDEDEVCDDSEHQTE